MDDLTILKRTKKIKFSQGDPYGFTLVELLLVVTIIGIIIALILPRAGRAKKDSQFSIIRQNCNEISMKIITYAEDLARIQNPKTSYTIKDILYSDIRGDDETSIKSKKLVDKYTGNSDFNVVEKLFSPENGLRNPFNGTNHFSYVNNDISVPSRKAGLIYFIAGKNPASRDYLDFYLLITDIVGEGKAGEWHGSMDMTPETMRHGVFVAKLYDDQEYGGVELDSELIREPAPEYDSSSGREKLSAQ